MELLRFEPASGLLNYVTKMSKEHGYTKSAVIITDKTEFSFWLDWIAENNLNRQCLLTCHEQLSKDHDMVFVVGDFSEAQKAHDFISKITVIFCEWNRSEYTKQPLWFDKANLLVRADRETGTHEIEPLVA